MESTIRVASPVADPNRDWLIPDQQGEYHPTAYQPGQEFTGFVARERSRISAALRASELDSPLWYELHAAQQALAWAMDPDSAASPFDSIARRYPALSEGKEP